MAVTGTGVGSGVTVKSLSGDGKGIILSSAQTINDGVTLTFSLDKNYPYVDYYEIKHRYTEDGAYQIIAAVTK